MRAILPNRLVLRAEVEKLDPRSKKMKSVSLLFHRRLFILAAMLILPLGVALAGPGHGTKASGASASGKVGKAGEVTRTITVTMQDNVFDKRQINIRAGETVRFILKNKGEFLHEFNIGSPHNHAQHQKEMMQMMNMGMLTPTGFNTSKMGMSHGGMGKATMKHDDPNSVLVKPGETKELIWKFVKSSNLEFACNLPGHYQSGMVGRFNIKG
jgi:uncharacterized cupredoxin-like copper-binding protein